MTETLDSHLHDYLDCFARHGFLFVHIPRTGGTTFEHCFGVRFSTFHLRAQYCRNLSTYRTEQPGLVAIVRHPYDRMKSVYRFLMSAGNEIDITLQQDVRRGLTFESFCVNLPKLLRRHNSVFLWSQWSFLQIEEGPPVGTTLRYERFEHDIPAFMRNHGLAGNVALPRMRATGESDVVIEDTSVARAAIARWYKTDFDALGYSMAAH
jgi:hypothetical protein